MLQFLFTGIAASSHYNAWGGGSNVLCLDLNVSYTNYVSGSQGMKNKRYFVNVWARNQNLNCQTH